MPARGGQVDFVAFIQALAILIPGALILTMPVVRMILAWANKRTLKDELARTNDRLDKLESQLVDSHKVIENAFLIQKNSFENYNLVLENLSQNLTSMGVRIDNLDNRLTKHFDHFDDLSNRVSKLETHVYREKEEGI